MNIEKKRIKIYTNGENIYGRIELDKLAIPETVKVTLEGKTIIPESFDEFGRPIFTQEQAELYMYKEDLRSEKEGPLYAEIAYEERKFDVSKEKIDTIEGIRESLCDISDLNEMLNNRRIFKKLHDDEILNRFMLFGTYQLDEFGQVTAVSRDYVGKLKYRDDIESYETFCSNNIEGFYLSTPGYCIPTSDSICQCCGKKFTIDDVKNDLCVKIEGKYYHDRCYREYRRFVEIDKFTRQLMNRVYAKKDYTFELLPNGYCDKSCCSHIPWFLFHTIDGDIIMGWRKRVISIEWQKNYKDFDMKELFKEENVTKWERNSGKERGIHAWGKDKAYEYLTKVLKAVNPEYKNY